MMQEDKYVKGTCMRKCPKSEIIMREKERLLHKLEALEGTENHPKPKADWNRMVKSFSRSAAGKNMDSPENLRPADVLLDTVGYLLDTILTNTQYPFVVIYDFIMDRIRSVRQDIVIQSLMRAPTISLLQPIVRFYAYASYRLCEEPTSAFEPTINNKHLQECMKRLLVLYDDCDIFLQKSNKAGIQTNSFEAIYADFRSQIEAIYLLHNMGEAIAITRALNLPKRWRDSTVEIALKISLYCLAGNWIKVCNLIKDLPALLGSIAALHLPAIRRKAFSIMSTAYNSKNLLYPIAVLEEALLYSNTCDILSDLKYYNIVCVGDNVQFLRANFNNNVKTVQPRHEQFVDAKLSRQTMTGLILYGII